MKKQKVGISSILILLMVSFFPAEILAAPYYEGKVITIICGQAAGGGFDIWARLLAKHMPKYIPGSPAMIVQNMAGANSMIATNYLFSEVKPDGLTILTMDRGVLFSKLMKLEGVRYDLSKFAWIGSISSEAVALFVRSALPYKTFNDILQSRESIPIGDMGTGSYSRVLPIILRDQAGVKFKLVSYPGGSADIRLAVQGKEIDCFFIAYSVFAMEAERGLVRPVLRGRVVEPGIEKIPPIDDFVKDEKAKKILALYSAGDRIAKPYVAPPGTPDNVMSILREAFRKACADPELVAEAKKIKRNAIYTSGKEALDVVNFVLNQPEDIVREYVRYGNF